VSTTSRRKPADRPLPELRVTIAEARRLIGEQLDRGIRLRDKQLLSPEDLNAAQEECISWLDYTRDLLRRIISTDEVAKEFRSASAMASWGSGIFSIDVQDFKGDMAVYVGRLKSLVERLPLYEPEAMQVSSSPSVRPASDATHPLFKKVRVPGLSAKASPPEGRPAVFVVHGRDLAAVDRVVRLLHELDLHPVVLKEQPNKGRTIIEKFEAYAEVRFAVVLLTGDDVGSLAGAAMGELRPRARQNVILELGFFVGRLGRDKVAALEQPGLERPSDIDGVLYIALDAGDTWRLQLAKEFKAAGLPVDLNRL
jgi:predicted nucleotide-binding protein